MSTIRVLDDGRTHRFAGDRYLVVRSDWQPPGMWALGDAPEFFDNPPGKDGNGNPVSIVNEYFDRLRRDLCASGLRCKAVWMRCDDRPDMMRFIGEKSRVILQDGSDMDPAKLEPVALVIEFEDHRAATEFRLKFG